ncbi:MAG: sugar phosphate isomerase/epimerase family protein [Bacilli bacterium]
MKIAYSNLACPEWSMKQVVDNAARYGYDGVEVRLYDGEVIASDLSASRRKALVQMARDAGVELIGVGASTRFAMADRGLRSQNEEQLRAYLELAHDMEIPFVRTFGGACKDSPAAGIERVAEALNRVAGRAEELDVQVLLETHDDFSASHRVRDVLNRVSSPAVGALWDTHHPVRMGESVDETYGNLASRLRHVHLKDAKQQGDEWRLVLFGDGDVPVAGIVRKLKRTGYEGYLTIEWERKWHPEIASADVALPQHITLLKEYLAS